MFSTKMATALLRTCVIGMKYIVLISADVIQDAFHANDRWGSHWMVKVDSVRCEGRDSNISMISVVRHLDDSHVTCGACHFG
jgi:hypothetical protein